MFLRKFMPKSLYGRFLLIIILPTILVQCVAIYIFYERHWDSLSRNMAGSLSGEIRYVISALTSLPLDQRKNFLIGIDKHMRLKVGTMDPNASVQALNTERYAFFQNSLAQQLPFPVRAYDAPNGKQLVIDIKTADDSGLRFVTTRKRLFNSTTYIFVLWLTGSALILTIVSVLFLKNQLRAIVRLTDAAENFDRGVDSSDFKPGGASEIRRASIAFIEMRERIRQLLGKHDDIKHNIAQKVEVDLTDIDQTLTKMKTSESVKRLQKRVAKVRKTLSE